MEYHPWDNKNRNTHTNTNTTGAGIFKEIVLRRRVKFLFRCVRPALRMTPAIEFAVALLKQFSCFLLPRVIAETGGVKRHTGRIAHPIVSVGLLTKDLSHFVICLLYWFAREALFQIRLSSGTWPWLVFTSNSSDRQRSTRESSFDPPRVQTLVSGTPQ